MEIDMLIFLIDILVIVGFSVYSAEEIKKDLGYINRIAFIIPFSVFAFNLVLDIKSLPDVLPDQLVTLFFGIVFGYVFGLITYASNNFLKKIKRRILPR